MPQPLRLAAVRVEARALRAWRARYRREMNCQIRHDAWHERGFGRSYLLRLNGRAVGYGAMTDSRYDRGTIFEFYVLPAFRARVRPLFRTLLAASRAGKIQAQTNDRLLHLMLLDFTRSVRTDAILFADALTTRLPRPPGMRLRRLDAAARGRVFPHRGEPVGEWGLEKVGVVVATGGAYFHYNPPYGDLYMEVHPRHRRRGYGAFLVQELKRIYRRAGKIPAARCGAGNAASRATLEKAGMLPCARILKGRVAAAPR